MNALPLVAPAAPPSTGSSSIDALVPALGATSRKARLLVVHCSATVSGERIGAKGERALPGVRAAQVIDGWHAQRGFKRASVPRAAFNPGLASIGYHWVIDIDGSVQTGRHPDEIGAHVAGFNSTTLGLCMVGGAEPQARYTQQQWAALAQLVRRVASVYSLPLRTPLDPAKGSGVCGHRDLSPDADGSGRVEQREWLKTCPGFEVGLWLDAGLVAPPQHTITTAAQRAAAGARA